MARVLFRSLTCEAPRLHQAGGKKLAGTGRRDAGRDGSCGYRWWKGRPGPGEQFLERAGGRLAAGNTAGQLLLFAARDRLGVAVAEVTALAAIELPHRGHQPVLDRLRGGERKAVVERQCRIVPGKILGLCPNWLGLRL